MTRLFISTKLKVTIPSEIDMCIVGRLTSVTSWDPRMNVLKVGFPYENKIGWYLEVLRIVNETYGPVELVFDDEEFLSTFSIPESDGTNILKVDWNTVNKFYETYPETECKLNDFSHLGAANLIELLSVCEDDIYIGRYVHNAAARIIAMRLKYKPIKPGILILHKNSSNFDPLIKFFVSNGHHVYIHNDYNGVPLSKYAEDNAKVFHFRTYGRWGAPELAFAMFECMGQAFKTEDYVISISDDSVPTCDYESWINNFYELTSFGHKSIVQIGADNNYKSNYIKYHFGMASKLMTSRRLNNLEVRKGSQWNALTRHDFNRIERYLEGHQAYVREFYTVPYLDERLIPTLYNLCGLIADVNERYVYAPFNTDMATGRKVTLEEIQKLDKKQYLFARKWNYSDEGVIPPFTNG